MNEKYISKDVLFAEIINYTKQNKINWETNYRGIYKGLNTPDSIFKDYKIIIERWTLKKVDGFKIAKMNNNGDNFKINFINNINHQKNIELTACTDCANSYKMFDEIHLRVLN